MSYCTNCNVRAVYVNGLCYECKQKSMKRKASPHGIMVYDKYNPQMSKAIVVPVSDAIVAEKRKKRIRKTPQVIKGELLTSSLCKGYQLIYWKNLEDKPEIDEDNVVYYYIEVRPYSKTKKIQVMADHKKEIIYFPAISLTKCYVKSVRQNILNIIAEN